MSSTDEASDGSGGEHHGETDTTASRFWLTNDAAALALVGVLCVLVLLDGAGVTTLPDTLLTAYVAYAGAAVVWLFGRGAARIIFGGRER